MLSLQISNLPRWDLTHFYPSIEDETVNQDLEKTVRAAEKFQKSYEVYFKNNLWTGQDLLTAIREFERIEELMGKLMSFAYLNYATHLTDPRVLTFFQFIQEKITASSSQLIFFTLDLSQMENSLLLKAYQENTDLYFYKPWIEGLRLLSPYQLDHKLEKLFHEKSVTSRNAWVRLYDETLATLTFPYDNKSLALSQILDLLSHKDAAIRKAAALSLEAGLKEKLSLFTMITNTLAKDKEIEDTWRQYPHPVSARNLSNQVEDEVVQTLVNTVKDNYKNLSHRYYGLKATCLGVERLEYWDRNAPLPEAEDQLIPWDTARQIVLEAYESFSPKMAEIGERFFNEGWIDVPALSSKHSGAFAHATVPCVHPYILLNYQGRLRDVMTLAHELGHGIHQVLAGKLGVFLSSTPLTIAETASVFGEMLTFRSLLKKTTSTSQRRTLIGTKIDDMLNTSIRQIAFFEFENRLHHRRKTGELSSEELGEIWLQTQKEALGPCVNLDSTTSPYWSYICHFIHAPFYVYAYAFGDCLVNSLYCIYEQGFPDFREKYEDLLSAGGSKRYNDLLAPFHLDACDPVFWQKGLNVIGDLIDEFESLMGK